MIQIDEILLSDDLFERKFVCDLKACKGICCVEGDAGAPLEEEETKILEKIYPKVKPYLRKEGIESIEKQGTWVKDEDGDLVTPLIDGAECAYVIFEKDGTAKCGIEKAYEQGDVTFKKPISCHLYPIRVAKLSVGMAMNYDRWSICSPACQLGEKLRVKVYQFLKEPIIRKYGQGFYDKMEQADHELFEYKKASKKSK